MFIRKLLNAAPENFPLLALPPELRGVIGQHLSSPDLLALSVTCKPFRYLYQQKVAERAAKLIDYVLKPTEENVKKAKVMIAADPYIMFVETVGVEWASGVEEFVDAEDETQRRAVPRIVKSSPFKAALGTGDKELYEYMAEYFEKVVYKDGNGEIIETGTQRAKKQIHEQFPDGFDYPKVEKEFTDLMAEIVNAITIDQTLIDDNIENQTTQLLLKQFRDYFLPKVVTQGHHFNLKYLMKALTTCNQNWNSWNGNQTSLFWCQMIGYLERLVPVTYAQVICHALDNLPMLYGGSTPPPRTFTVYNQELASNISYFPFISARPSEGLGFDFAINIQTPSLDSIATKEAMWSDFTVTYLIIFCEKQSKNIKNFNNRVELRAEPISEPRRKWCWIL